jgi:hypothetical protein
MFAQGVNDRKWPDGGGARRSLFERRVRVEIANGAVGGGWGNRPSQAAQEDRRGSPAVRFRTDAFKKRQDAWLACAFTH